MTEGITKIKNGMIKGVKIGGVQGGKKGGKTIKELSILL
jgi:hypothetical protein